MSEYYWGYAAAANAHLINPFDDKKRTTEEPPRLQPPRDVGEQADEEDANSTQPLPPPPSRPAARSSSTSRAFGRPRFRAHTRTTSTDSGSSSSRRAGYRSSHDTPPSARAASSAGEDSSERERREHKEHKEHKDRKEHKEHRSRWHHRWASASATKDAATTAASPSLPQPQTPRSSPAPWSVPDDLSPASAPASPAPPGSASATASSRPRLLQKPSPITSAATSEHTLPRHRVPSNPSSPLGRLPHKQPPATPPRDGTTLQAESAPACSRSERSFSAATSTPADENPGFARGSRSSVSATIAGIAAASGAATPRSVTSPCKVSLSQRITQHLADRRHHQQAAGSQVPQVPHASLAQTQSQQRQHHAPVLRESPAIQKITVPFARAESNSSGSGATVSSARTMMSATDLPPAADGPPYRTGPPSSARPSNPRSRRHFVVRNGRTYLADPTLDYPLPVDLPELHRCSMKTLMLFQLFGGPIVSPLFQDRPPARILDLACGSGFWSMMCHRYWAKKGHPNIHFTGVDIAPIAGASGWGPDDPAPSASSASSMSDGTVPAASLRPPDKDMKWRFVQHDIRRFPWPFNAAEFDFVMMQSTSTVAPFHMAQSFTSEILRVLRPGGTLEIWESDFIIRMLRPHVPAVSAAVPGGWSSAAAAAAATTAANAGPDSDGGEDDEDDDDDASSNGSSDSKREPSERRKEASRNGAYVVTSNTPMSSPLNNFLVEYNAWVTKGLAACQLTPVPCTTINYILLQEDQLTGVDSRRLAVPLSEVKWEREGVGGVVTKGDGKSYVSTTAKAGKGGEEGGGGGGGEGSSIGGSVGAGSGSGSSKGKGLSANQAALRRTALETVVQLIQSLEPLLREASGKSQDEWDAWQGKMQNNLLLENGTSWGECLEVGAWYARKK